MIDILQTVIWFFIAIAILIAVHEFGHFWVAKKLGVKVLRFSIGMGKVIFSRKYGPDQTEFALSAFPIGGYVAMLNDQEDAVDEADKPRAFNNQPIWKRSLITLAGPVFNFLLAIVAYWLVAVWGVTGLKPVIDQVGINSIAEQAGLEPGMEIVQIEGWDTKTWDAVFQESLPKVVQRSELNMIVRDQNGIDKNFTLDLSGLDIDRDIRQPFDAMGIYIFDAPPVVGKILEGKSAARAGLKAGDRIIQLGDEKINHWNQIGRYLYDKANKQISITLVRDGQQMSVTATPDKFTRKGISIGLLGIGPAKPDTNREYEQVENQYSLLDGIAYSLHRTWNTSYVTGKVLSLMVTLEVSLINISGPVNIAVVAGQSASIGIEYYILFLALVSISLGILNLLPVPILDGGHLVYYAVEAIKGSPVSETVEAVGQRIGIMMLIMLMTLAFYNDIVRLTT